MRFLPELSDNLMGIWKSSAQLEASISVSAIFAPSTARWSIYQQIRMPSGERRSQYSPQPAHQERDTRTRLQVCRCGVVTGH